MKIVVNSNSNHEWNIEIQKIVSKYGFECKNRKILDSSNSHLEKIPNSSQLTPQCIEIDGVFWSNVSPEELEKYIREKTFFSRSRFVEDDQDEHTIADEESEAIRSKTTRFF